MEFSKCIKVCKPVSSVKRKRVSKDMKESDCTNHFACDEPGQEKPVLRRRWLNAEKDKGKGKLFEEYSFNKGGLFSAKAIKLMESEKLGQFSWYFKQEVIDLNVALKSSILARDVLHHAVEGTLREFMTWKASQWDYLFHQISGFMEVDEVLQSMGLNTSSNIKFKESSS